jgi:glycosyltransferase involved in cell wall biosynthesis
MKDQMILLDGSHLLRSDGTGISSYSRTLASSLRSAGATIGLLMDRRSVTRSDDLPIAAAMQVFGAQASGNLRLRRIGIAWATRFGHRRRLSARTIQLAGVDISSLSPPLPAHDAILNANNFFNHAHAAFSWSGKSTQIVPDQALAAMHWTSPVPAYVSGVPNFYTLHDLIPLQFPHLVLHQGGRWARLHQAVLRHADHIVTVSERSREDIIKILGVPADRVTNTYQPVPCVLVQPQENAERLVTNVYGTQPGKYAFFCGALEPKKNLYRLIEAFLTAGTDLRLLIAGPLGWLYDDVLEIIERSGAGTIQAPQKTSVHYLGYLPRRHVVALMQCARFFAFPSIYEGFGLPVMEAMQLGTPVLASRGGSLPEVMGEAGLLVDALNIDELAGAIRRLALDDELCAELARRGPLQAARFSPEVYRDRLSALYARNGIPLTKFVI